MTVIAKPIASNGIELFYEERGPRDGPAVVFVMGLSAQMVFWPDTILDALAGEGYRVIRFDNRDVGLSTKFKTPHRFNLPNSMMRYMAGRSFDTPYTLHDMVADTIGLLDALAIPAAHFVGASMGGMISQLAAATHPDRVLSLTSIMSSPNSPWTLPPKLSAFGALVGPRQPASSADAYQRMAIELMRKLAGTLPQDEAQLEQAFLQSWERGLYPRGVRNQFMGILATGSFRKQLQHIRVPTTIIHGSHDPLIRPAGGRASARAIPGARLEIIRGMGHDFPRAAQPRIAELIHTTAQQRQQQA